MLCKKDNVFGVECPTNNYTIEAILLREAQSSFHSSVKPSTVFFQNVFGSDEEARKQRDKRFLELSEELDLLAKAHPEADNSI
jgi:hypothetical protein